MRNLVIATFIYLFTSVPGALASDAVTRATPATTSSNASATAERLRKHAARKKNGAAKANATTAQPVKWLCKGNQPLWITGDMQRDQILTMRWNRKNYRLPRVQTSTGADRFYDPASGMSWVVIPSKAMLFNDKGQYKQRLADECRSHAMIAQDIPAPTQAEAIRKTR
ncbi:hypothetical protein [Mycoavidus sp. B2-EB]|uniref:hypothetical protein n=1 Tax=Mycoavidus sp. B2-EB TaxID=2651972 RepID=UPI0016253B23|nr:hypothetical protein [Mycoavidus sp. B2-EB]BBO60133.1 hypothetical protein MPB2EB_1272 [Mycoavidus sp. B2-EB]